MKMIQPLVNKLLLYFLCIFLEKYDIPTENYFGYAWQIFFGWGRVGGVNLKHPNSFPSTPPPHLTFKPP